MISLKTLRSLSTYPQNEEKMDRPLSLLTNERSILFIKYDFIASSTTNGKNRPSFINNVWEKKMIEHANKDE